MQASTWVTNTGKKLICGLCVSLTNSHFQKEVLKIRDVALDTNGKPINNMCSLHVLVEGDERKDALNFFWDAYHKHT